MKKILQQNSLTSDLIILGTLAFLAIIIVSLHTYDLFFPPVGSLLNFSVANPGLGLAQHNSKFNQKYIGNHQRYYFQQIERSVDKDTIIEVFIKNDLITDRYYEDLINYYMAKNKGKATPISHLGNQAHLLFYSQEECSTFINTSHLIIDTKNAIYHLTIIQRENTSSLTGVIKPEKMVDFAQNLIERLEKYWINS